MNNSDNNSFKSNPTKEKRNLSRNNRINFSSSYLATYKLINTDFLGMKIGLNQYLYINNNTNLREEYLDLILGRKNYTLSVASKYHYPGLRCGYITKELINNNYGLDKYFKPVGFLVKGALKFVINTKHGINFETINEEMYSKRFASFEKEGNGIFGLDYFFFLLVQLDILLKESLILKGIL